MDFTGDSSTSARMPVSLNVRASIKTIVSTSTKKGLIFETALAVLKSHKPLLAYAYAQTDGHITDTNRSEQ